MNRSQKRDMQYSFINSLRNPLHMHVIDDNWRKEKFTNLDLIIPNRIVQEHLKSDHNESDPLAGGATIASKDGTTANSGGSTVTSIAQARRWDDLCMNELLNEKIEQFQETPMNQIDELARGIQIKGDFRKIR